jgi:hypothetical protein
MARKTRKSIYGKEIKDINITNLLGNALEESFDPDWELDLKDNWMDVLEEKLHKLDFFEHNYISDYGSYWCGVLTLEPFDTLTEKYTEEEILNLIKNHHFAMLHTNDGTVLRFQNPTSSPLYRFFNKHKEDGFGLNVTYSVNGLLSKIESFLKSELETNLSNYGEWIPYEDEEIA